jgi:hypothetical protein
MFKSQKIIIFSILLALVGIGATVAIGVGISVRNSVNPDKSSAATADIVSEFSGRLTCKTSAGTIYTKKNIVSTVKADFYSIDESKPVISQDWNPYQYTVSSINKDGTFKLSGSAPKEYNFVSLGIKDSNQGVATNCSDFSKLIDNSGNGVCLNKEVTKEITNSCWGAYTYMCKRNLDTSTFNGFDFALTKCPEPILDLKTKGFPSSTISKNAGDTLTMYFNGEDLSDYTTLNTNYYIGAQGLSDIYSSYKVYYCNGLTDTSCTSEVILPTVPPEVSVSPWNIIALGKDKTIKVEGKLLSTAKTNVPVKVQYAQLPSATLPLLNDSNSLDNIWTGSISILSTNPVTSTTSSSTSSVSSVSSSRSSVSSNSSTISSRSSSSSNGSVVSSTESSISTETSSSEESSISSVESTSSRSTSSIKPYVPVTTTPSNDNTTLLLALAALLVLFLVSLFVVYRKYKNEKESKEVFTPSPTSETPPSSETPPASTTA